MVRVGSVQICVDYVGCTRRDQRPDLVNLPQGRAEQDSREACSDYAIWTMGLKSLTVLLLGKDGACEQSIFQNDAQQRDASQLCQRFKFSARHE